MYDNYDSFFVLCTIYIYMYCIIKERAITSISFFLQCLKDATKTNYSNNFYSFSYIGFIIKTKFSTLIKCKHNRPNLWAFSSHWILFKTVIIPTAYKVWLFSGHDLGYAPEMLTKGCYHAESFTVWSLGILAYNLASGRGPYNSTEEITRGKLQM